MLQTRQKLYTFKLAWIKITSYMEHFLETDFTWLEEVFWAQPSAFVSYTQHKLDQTPAFENNKINIKKRMTEFLINNTAATTQRNDFSEKERGGQHVMNERMRREKQRHGYMRLHSMLPSRTKRDKLSITTKAAQEIEELKKRREELERHKSKMDKVLGARESIGEGSEMEEANIRINVAYPASGVDSMLEVLKCLKHTNSNIRLIQSKFLPQQFSAVLGIETKVGAAEVESAIHRTLIKVEERFRFNGIEPSYQN